MKSNKNLRYSVNKETKWVTLRDDIMFKRIFSENPEFLKSLLKCTFKFDDKDLEGMSINNSGAILPTKEGMKNYITDIIVTLKNGDKVIVEMQVFNTESAMIKHELYADREISKQGKKLEKKEEEKGKDKDKYDYKKIKKVYQLVIIALNYVVDKNSHILLETYTKKGDKNPLHKIMEKYRKTVWLDLEGEINYDKDEKELIGLVTLFRANTLEESMKSVKYGKLMKEIIEKMKDYMEDDRMSTHEEKQREYIECLIEIEREEAREEARKEALKEGIEKGKIEGIAEGIEQTNYEVAKKMILKGSSFDEIKEIINISEEKLNDIKNSLSLKLVP